MTINKHKQVFIFIFVAICIGVVVMQYTNTFAWFAFVCFILATLSPQLGKDEVDFWYYTLGIIGIVLLFNSQTFERNKLANNDALLNRQIYIQKLTALNSELQKSITIKNHTNVLQQISLRFREKFNSLDNPNLLECVSGQQNTSICNELFLSKKIVEDLSAVQSISQEKLNDHTFAQIKSILTGSSGILIDDILLPTVFVAGMFFEDYKKDSELELHKYLTNQIDEFSKISNVHDDMVKSSDDTFKLKIFLSTMWQYILCIALSLKLARLDVLRQISFVFSKEYWKNI
jgi:hypothetical protein